MAERGRGRADSFEESRVSSGRSHTQSVRCERQARSAQAGVLSHLAARGLAEARVKECVSVYVRVRHVCMLQDLQGCESPHHYSDRRDVNLR